MHERVTKHAVQDLKVFLTNKSKTGAVYEVDSAETHTVLGKRMRLQDPSDEISEKRQGIGRTSK